MISIKEFCSFFFHQYVFHLLVLRDNENVKVIIESNNSNVHKKIVDSNKINLFVNTVILQLQFTIYIAYKLVSAGLTL